MPTTKAKLRNPKRKSTPTAPEAVAAHGAVASGCFVLALLSQKLGFEKQV